jgi:predicted ATPase
VLDHLCQRGLLAKDGGAWHLQAPLHTIDFEVPETLREVIDARVTRLSAEEQHALEVASIAGIEFDPQSCADAAGLDPERMDELCRMLADRHCILRRPPGDPLGSADNGTTRYAFAHAMYREVLYRRQAPGRRARLHLKLHRPELVYAAAASQLRPVLEDAGSD